MSLLFVNACMRAESRTERLARMWLEGYDGEVEELCVGELDFEPLTSASIATYERAVASARYDEPMFAYAKQFAAADEILIAAPLWNFSMPAKLHDYLELVCTQGLSFDIAPDGGYVSLCRAKRLTFVMTSGGPVENPADDHAFGYVKTLSDWFWHIPQVVRVAAEGLDVVGANVDALLAQALVG